MLSSSNSRRILELLRLYHFNARYLSNDYPQGLRSIEEAVLVAMASLSEIRAAEVVAALHVDKSTVSKALTSLRRGRYVTSSVNLHDKRVRSIAFTKRGSQHLQKHAAYHQKLVAAFSAHLTTDELNRLQDYLTRFADGDGAAPIAAREAESPLIVQMRRLGRAHSILGSSYLGSEFSIGEWLVLCAVRDLTAPVTPTLLSRWIGVPKNTLSQMLSRLRSKRLISTRDLRHDGRKLEVVLRSAGITISGDDCEEAIFSGIRELFGGTGRGFYRNF
jgi:DNA-binding MarR family transcriptional regulator